MCAKVVCVFVKTESQTFLDQEFAKPKSKLDLGFQNTEPKLFKNIRSFTFVHKSEMVAHSALP